MEPILNEEELRALRGAIAPASLPRRSTTSKEPSPVALISDDKASLAARPTGSRVATRWAQVMRTRLKQALGMHLELEVVGVETIHGPTLKDELAVSWASAAEISGRESLAAVTASGAVISWAAALLLGGSSEGEQDLVEERPASAMTLSIFGRVGEIVISSLADAWRQEQPAQVTHIKDAKRVALLRAELLETDPLLALTLNASGPTTGRFRLIAKPEVLVSPRLHVRNAGTTSDKAMTALGEVPIEVKVELGRTSIKLSELGTLAVGSLLTLSQPTDALLPIACAGLVKAYGRPAVSRGSIAVEVVTHEEGAKKP